MSVVAESEGALEKLVEKGVTVAFATPICRFGGDAPDPPEATASDAGAVPAPVNPPQPSILQGRQHRAVLARGKDGEMVDAAVVTLALGCDHRILYGAPAPSSRPDRAAARGALVSAGAESWL